MSKGVRIPLHEIDIMLSAYKRQAGTIPRMQIYQDLFELFEGKYHINSIASVVQRYQPTTNIAEVILKKGAARMAARIVRRANVTEAIDVLSRPNIGVLDPIKKAEGGGGFIMSITAESCGTVKVGMAIAGPPEAAQISTNLRPLHSDPSVMITSGEVIDVETSPDTQLKRPEGLFAKALERSKARLDAAQRRAGIEPRAERGRPSPQPRQHQEDFGVPGYYEQSQD